MTPSRLSWCVVIPYGSEDVADSVAVYLLEKFGATLNPIAVRLLPIHPTMNQERSTPMKKKAKAKPAAKKAAGKKSGFVPFGKKK